MLSTAQKNLSKSLTKNTAADMGAEGTAAPAPKQEVS